MAYFTLSMLVLTTSSCAPLAVVELVFVAVDAALPPPDKQEVITAQANSERSSVLLIAALDNDDGEVWKFALQNLLQII